VPELNCIKQNNASMVYIVVEGRTPKYFYVKREGESMTGFMQINQEQFFFLNL